MTAESEVMAETRRPPAAGGLRSSDCARPLLIPPAALRLVLVLIVGAEEIGAVEAAHPRQAVDGVVVVLDGAGDAGRIPLKIFLHRDRGVGHAVRVAVGAVDAQ